MAMIVNYYFAWKVACSLAVRSKSEFDEVFALLRKVESSLLSPILGTLENDSCPQTIFVAERLENVLLPDYDIEQIQSLLKTLIDIISKLASLNLSHQLNIQDAKLTISGWVLSGTASITVSPTCNYEGKLGSIISALPSSRLSQDKILLEDSKDLAESQDANYEHLLEHPFFFPKAKRFLDFDACLIGPKAFRRRWTS